MRPKLIDFPLPIRIDKYTRLFRIRGADVYFHWSVLAIALVILLNSLRQPLISITAAVAYLCILLIHEIGHLVAAQRRGSEVLNITIYPLHGYCKCQAPWSRYEECIIAWGGVLAQLLIAVPFVGWLVAFGYTQNETLNALLAILGVFNVVIAGYNLLPFGRLDGATTWGIFGEWNRQRKRRSARAQWR